MMESINLNGRWHLRKAPLETKGEQGLRLVMDRPGQSDRSGPPDLSQASDKSEASDKSDLSDTSETSDQPVQPVHWIRAAVPGEVHLDLIRAGLMPEPLHDRNTHKCRWPEDHSWWYRRAFRVPSSLLTADRVDLVCDGIDYYGQIFINAKLTGETTNALVPARLEAKPFLVPGLNEIAVRVTAGTELAPPAAEAPAQWTRPHMNDLNHPRAFLRKPQFTYGWDWVEALPNIGIWRGMRLEFFRQARIADVMLNYVPGTNPAVDAEVIAENLHNFIDHPAEITVDLTAPSGARHTASARIDLQPGQSPVRLHIPISRPELWWPAGMGPQNLYEVHVRIADRSGTELDSRTLSYGLRTITLDRSLLSSLNTSAKPNSPRIPPDSTPQGTERRFCLQVNGRDVFCRGGNWIPADAILARVTETKTRTLLAEARNANFNMLRVWGGGVFESNFFYEECDRQGILVWQDFLFACLLYPDDNPAYCQEIRHEAELAVRRLRHHACLALWCGNNENLWGFSEWWPGQPNRGSRIYGQILPEVCRTLDPARIYWPSSPAGGPWPNGEDAGDTHWWPLASMSGDMARRVNPYVYDECRAKFVSEFGVLGPPALQSYRDCITAKDLTPESPAILEHDNTFDKGTVLAGIRHHYRDTEGMSLSEYVLYGGMFQSVMYEYSLERMRFREGECQGALVWMWDDCWVETGWTPLDYYLRRKPSFYAIKRAFKPVKLIAHRTGESITLRAFNSGTDHVSGHVEYGWFHVSGNETRTRRVSIKLSPFCRKEVARIPLPGSLNTTEWVFGAILEGSHSDTALLRLHVWREMAGPKPNLRLKFEPGALTVESNVYAHGVHLSDSGKAVLSDNYFDLLPGRPKRIAVEGKLPRNKTFAAMGAE